MGKISVYTMKTVRREQWRRNMLLIKRYFMG